MSSISIQLLKNLRLYRLYHKIDAIDVISEKYRTHSVSILTIFDRISISNEVLTALILTTKDSGTFQYVPYSLMHKYFDAEHFCQKYLEKGLK